MSDALQMWREKLAFYEEQEAIAVGADQQFQLKKQITEAKSKVAELEASGGRSKPTPPIEPSFDISHIDKYAPKDLIGRETEMKLLNDAWDLAVRGDAQRPRVMTFVALGGEGKTSLVAKWAADLAGRGWAGCEGAFAWSFYSQGTDEKTADSSDLFLKEALEFFGEPELAASSESGYEKGRRLARLIAARRTLLILDGLEPLQYSPESPMRGELKDEGLSVLLKRLVAQNPGLCVVTTRITIPDLKAYRDTSSPEISLDRLSTTAGVHLLRTLGVGIGSNNDFEQLVEEVKGHALTLTLVGSYLATAYAGDIRKRDLIKLEEADAEVHGGHAFRVIESYVDWLKTKNINRPLVALLRLMGLFDRPVDAGCLNALRATPAISGLTEALVKISDPDLNVALKRLSDARLLSVNRDRAGSLVSIDTHALIREYFGKQLKDVNSVQWRLAHGRLYKHLCKTTKDKPNATLDDLQPLYQAVAHGCQAGSQQEACEKVYLNRILRGTGSDGFYSTDTLGAFGADLGAIACFFEKPWTRVSPALTESDQAWLLSEAATRLRGLGRLTESLEPMRAGLGNAVRREDWSNAARGAGSLSELGLTLGTIAEALEDAERSVTYADRSGDVFLRMAFRTPQADALNQAGRRDESLKLFLEAEQMQAEEHPEYPLLYSLWGFRYSDLLLTNAERAAWQVILHIRSEISNLEFQISDSQASPASLALLDAIESCRAVSERTTQTLDWLKKHFTNTRLLDIALDHLTLGRAGLYAAVLEKSENQKVKTVNFNSQFEISIPKSVIEGIENAVSFLRRAGQQQFLPPGLLNRAWLRSLTRALTNQQALGESAQSDLDEAWEIAERGPMPLFLTDIHLHRARLFFHLPPDQYPWTSPQHDLAQARELIQKHGYLRRMEELEDAEAAIR